MAATRHLRRLSAWLLQDIALVPASTAHVGLGQLLSSGFMHVGVMDSTPGKEVDP